MQLPHSRLLVVGAFSKEDKAPYLRYVRRERIRDVHFIGQVPDEELPRYYKTAAGGHFGRETKEFTWEKTDKAAALKKAAAALK